MITIPKFLDRSSEPVVRLIGVGNAGVNLADRMTVAHGDVISAVVMNSDMQSLSSSVVEAKVVIGPMATRGLGAGGDPEIGLDAARESVVEIESAISGADIVFLCAGLGGGTGSGAAGIVAELVKKNGALLIGLVTTPFAFEGRRRSTQAHVALDELAEHADAVIHFENDRMADLAAPRAGVSETFAACDDLLCGCLVALARLVASPGPLAVGLPDLLSVLEGREAVCLFGTGSATGGNRAHEALERAMRSPLLNRSHLGDDECSLLVHVSGPPNLSFAEVGVILEEVSRQVSDSGLIHLGVSTNDDGSSPVTVTLLGKHGRKAARRETVRSVRPAAKPAARRNSEVAEDEPELPVAAAPAPPKAAEGAVAVAEPEEKPVEKPPVRVQRPVSEPAKPKPVQPKVKQETLQFEPVARGRFEKIEPTIVEGEDLDVPTFLRRNTKGT
jgi:cell division protein FtsZ